MNKALRIVLWVLGGFLALLIVVPMLIPSASYRQAAEKAATDALGMPVKIGELRLRALPVPGVSISQVQVVDVAGGTPRISIGSGRVSVAVAPLFNGHVELTGITFRNITLRTSEQAKGGEVHTVHIDSITGAVRLANNTLTMPDWKASLYGGTVRMQATLSPLSGQDSTLQAAVKAEGIRIQPLLADAAGQRRVTGTFSSELKIAARGADEAALQRTLQVDGPVRLTKGQLTGLGMEGSAAALLVGGNLAAGPVMFDHFDLQLKVRGRDIWLNDITLASSHLNAKGQVKIAANKKLDGVIETSGMKGLTGAKLLVSGTTDAPRVYPAPSSLIGGAIGGAVGGPAGAAVGSKVGGAASDTLKGVGGAIKGLFGK
jgi:uncharacterized protein involved in outer membrane biogenesis